MEQIFNYFRKIFNKLLIKIFKNKFQKIKFFYFGVGVGSGVGVKWTLGLQVPSKLPIIKQVQLTKVVSLKISFSKKKNIIKILN